MERISENGNTNQYSYIKRKLRVFLMDTWAYPYRLPIFEELNKYVKLTVFFSKKHPHDHLDRISFQEYTFDIRSGKGIFLLIPIFLLFRRYDIYFIGQVGIQSVLGALFTRCISRRKRKPLILWTDFIDTPYYRKQQHYKKLIGDRIRRSILGSCTAAIAFGKLTEKYLHSINKNNIRIFNKMQIVPEICNKPYPGDKKKNKYYDKIVVLCISYFRKHKGLDLLIKAFKTMDTNHDVHLIVAGTGKDDTYLKTLAGNSSHIHFPGYIDRYHKFLYYSLADIFILPSLHEPWGLVINEAMYYSLPVIVTDTCGSAELVKDNGYVIKSGNISAIQNALKKLLDDKDLRIKMGKKSKNYINHYGLTYAVTSFLDIINYVNKKGL